MRSKHGPHKISLRLAIRPLVDAFEFRGRSTRKEVVSFWLLGMLAHAAKSSFDGPPSSLYYVLAIAWAILWEWPWVPLLVRRLHDQGHSGWWAMLQLTLVPVMLFGWLVAPVGKGPTLSYDLGTFRISRQIAWGTGTTVMASVMVATCIAMYVLYLLPPTKGANRFGPDPRRDVAPDRIGEAVPVET